MTWTEIKGLLSFTFFVAVGIGVVLGFVGGRYLMMRDVPQLKQERLENLGVVTVFYYSNTVSQTDSSPNETAWGDEVYEGMIAVSPDLLKTVIEKGDCVKLKVGNEIKTYIVDDVMNKKHFRSVDIFTFSKDKRILNSRQTGRLYLIN